MSNSPSTTERTQRDDNRPLVRVDGLKKHFFENDSLLDRLVGAEPTAVRAVDGVSFDVREGETLGLVGESGCGKSTTGKTLLRLLEATAGSVEFDGEALFELEGKELTAFRRRAQAVFQDPHSSLDPRMTVGDIVSQPLDVHDVGTRTEQLERVRDLLERVGLPDAGLDRYPHEFSGGQRQRIGIARALALDPDFLVLDEPTSALDVSVQAQVLNLLDGLQDDLGLTYLLISHDLSVIRHVCDRVAVMYLGEIVEIGPVDEIFEAPRHPYTQALLESVPQATVEEADREIDTLRGDVPSPRHPPSGCSFRTRCPKVIPPEELPIQQTEFRAITDIRQRLAGRDVSTEKVWEAAVGEVPDPENVDPETAAAFADAAADRLLDIDLPEPHHERVLTALASVARGDWTDAEAQLRETYESVCERENPPLVGGEHPSACHLDDG